MIDAERIKGALSDPIEVSRRLGLDKGARRQSGGLLVVCPAHADRGPSCSVTRGRDGTVRVRCFGCDLSGDVFTLIAAAERLDVRGDFPAVLTRAAELANISLEDSERPAPARRAEPTRPSEPPAIADEVFAELAGTILNLGRLDDSAIAGDVSRYLAGRGLLEAAQRAGWAALPPPEVQPSWVSMLVGIFGIEAVAYSGLVPMDEQRGPELRFAHAAARLVIPWRDPDGRVYTLQRRRLDGGSPKYVCASGRSPRWPYGVEVLRNAPPVLPVAFVEGAIDTLALDELSYRRGVPVIVLGIQGVSNWRASWGELARGRPAIVAFDADEAGEVAARRIAEDLAEGGARRIERWKPKAGKDWADGLMTEAA